jgi:hypothetical protein
MSPSGVRSTLLSDEQIHTDTAMELVSTEIMGRSVRVEYVNDKRGGVDGVRGGATPTFSAKKRAHEGKQDRHNST